MDVHSFNGIQVQGGSKNEQKINRKQLFQVSLAVFINLLAIHIYNWAEQLWLQNKIFSPWLGTPAEYAIVTGFILMAVSIYNSWKKFIFPWGLITCAYLVIATYYHFYGEVLHIGSFKLLSAVWKFKRTAVISMSILTFIGWASYSMLREAKNINTFFLIAGATCLLSGSLITLHIYRGNPACTYCEIIHNGRLSALLRHTSWYINEIRFLDPEQINNISCSTYLEKLDSLFPRPDQTRDFPDMYFILLESFVNPSWFEITRVSCMQPLQTFCSWDTIISPVYGGLSPQTLFEAISGIPARALFSPVEFIVMNSLPTLSLACRLKTLGYTTIIIDAARADFFNLDTAYRSLCFDSVIFLTDFNDVIKSGTIPDDSVYESTKTIISSVPSPKLVVILTIFGHYPANLNELPPADSTDSLLLNSVNIHFADHCNTVEMFANWFKRRIISLKRFNDWIQANSKNYILWAFSDHLYVLNGSVKDMYTQPSLKHVPSLLLINGKSVEFPQILPVWKAIHWIYSRAFYTKPEQHIKFASSLSTYRYAIIFSRHNKCTPDSLTMVTDATSWDET